MTEVLPMTTSAPMVGVEGLRMRYGRVEVLQDLDLEIARGKVTAVLGPNGAGKTTLIKSILGLVRPAGGSIRLDGAEVDIEGTYRERIGYMPQVARYPENLRVHEIISMVKDLRGRSGNLDEELISLFDLDSQFDKPFRALSGGNRQRVSAALAFLFSPDLLILDEPTAGLDPIASSTLKDKILREAANGKTFILTSHVMSEVEELADVVVYLLDGKVYFEESVSSLLTRTGEPNLERAMARMMLKVVA